MGHAAIRKALKPHGIGVATGEHAHNRMVFKQLLQAEAIDVVQIDSCRLAGVSEVISVLLMAAKYGLGPLLLSNLRFNICLVDLASLYVHMLEEWGYVNMLSI